MYNDTRMCNTTDICHPNASCTDSVGSYSCVCKPGYSGNGTHCMVFNDCSESTHSCHVNATCHVEYDMYNNGSTSCVCNSGFSGNGTQCDDIDECAQANDNDCHINGTCLNTIGSYTCICNEGHTGNGTTCLGNDCTKCKHDIKSLEILIQQFQKFYLNHEL